MSRVAIDRLFLRSLVLFLATPVLLMSTEFKPWFGNFLEIEPRMTYLFQSYRTVANENETVSYRAQDSFIVFSHAISPSASWSGESELTLAETKHRKFHFENIRLTGRYLWLDDIVEDPVSLVTGITLTQTTRTSLHDLSSFHHGQIEAEGTLSFGKEDSVDDSWKSRWWGVFGIGSADVGYPWIRTDINWEYNWYNEHHLSLFAHSLVGLGHHKLFHHDHDNAMRKFLGYGPIKHRSIDLGISYTHLFSFGRTLSIEYSRRVFARNFPEKVNLLRVELFLPFGL